MNQNNMKKSATWKEGSNMSVPSTFFQNGDIKIKTAPNEKHIDCSCDREDSGEDA